MSNRDQTKSRAGIVGAAIVPHAPQFLTLPDTEDHAQVARVNAAVRPTAAASVERFGASPVYDEIARLVTQHVAGLEREIGGR